MQDEPQAGPDTEITGQSATSLAGLIARGELTSAEVVEAHICRIEQINDDLNAVVVPLFDQAREEARQADVARRRGQTLGPLHGVPITVKEMFDVEGTATTAGLTTRRSHRAESDALVVARLRRAGAIVLGKTNVAQLGVMAETDNPLYGRTNNPWNLDRSSGGSSGGESAVIAAGGSPLGLGSDAGGSIRQPSHSCGIHGLKPTGRRLPLDGHFSSANWYESWSQPGPMARSVDDLELALWIMSGTAKSDAAPSDTVHTTADPGAVPAPLHTSRLIRPDRLRIGMYTELGSVSAAPAVRRAVAEAAEALRAAGASLEPFAPPDAERAWSLYTALFCADGLRDMRRQSRDCALDWRVKELFYFAKLPRWVRRPMALAYQLGGQHSTAQALRSIRRPVLTAPQFLQLVDEQRAYQRQFAAALDAARLDAIIGPPSPLPALTHGELYAHSTMLYTGLYNLLGLPAGVVATTRVAAGEESDRPSRRDYVEQCCLRVESGSAGLPIGVQVVARWRREDLVLTVMRTLEEHFRHTDTYPLTPPI